uniref:G-protein coupled receptors family 2 profile 2 domain-containing protein n=1 Tax=Oncorhynchus mykiss TaxID=8022 RepID=A0A8C7LUS7_ONCMY
MFQLSQCGYGVFVLVVYFFVLAVYKASSSPPGHEHFCTQISSLTRMCTLIMEISHIQQCIDLDSRQVSFSFTWNTTCEFPDLSSGFLDCAINITQPYVDNCKDRPLIQCVDQWAFIKMTNQSTTSQATTIRIENKVTTKTSHIARECDSENIGLTYANNNRTSVDAFLRKCKRKAKTIMTGRQLRFIKNIFHNITKQGPQKVILDGIKGSVTSHQKNNLLNFRMSLPSTNNATLEKMDDIWLEIPTEALRVFLGDTAEEVNLGVFWFEHHSMFPVEENNTELLNSRVVSVDVGEDISGLSNYFKITFLFQNASVENKSLACVFWDLENDTVAHWNSSGCVTETKENETVCSCNHLSFFAVLMSPVSGSSASLSSSSVWLLTLLSRVGCGISLCFLCLALLIHLRRGKSDDSLCIHIHLCVALLCLNLTFLINDSLASLGVHGLCVATAAATHYSLLCTLTWFSLEGFHLYLLIIRVFNIHVNRYLLKLGLVGWGIPGIVVTIIVACGKYGEYRIYQQDGGAIQM